MGQDEIYPLALPKGTVLGGQYVVEQVLGQGGFGITYKATDHKTGQSVAVKEFFPDSLTTRTNATTVSAFPGVRSESFAYGKGCFLQEAETLAQFIGNEHIVRVFSYFEENGTAYFVMEFIEGTSFDRYIREHGGKLSYEEAERILLPVIDALAAVHSKGIVHRDVTPDNIYITRDGTVKLLDFGAARYSLGDKSRSLDVVLKHGFAPKEQYTRHGKQGAFTDVYTLGASFYYAITGRRPPDSIDRIDEDELIPPSSLVGIPPEKEDVILKAMSVQPGNRYQTMVDFKEALMAASGEDALIPVADGDAQAADVPAAKPHLIHSFAAGTLAEPDLVSRQAAAEQPGNVPLPEASSPSQQSPISPQTAEKLPKKKLIVNRRAALWAGGAVALLLVVISAAAIRMSSREARQSGNSGQNTAGAAGSQSSGGGIEGTILDSDDGLTPSDEVYDPRLTFNFNDNGTACVACGRGDKNELVDVVIPSRVKKRGKTYVVTAIDLFAFSDCSSLTEIEIPDSVTTIGGYAFSGCSSLTEIRIPDSVTSIGDGAFSGCSSLTEIKIPDTVTSIGGCAFESCSSLTEIKIPDGVTTIGESTFSNCSNLTEIKIPDSVTSILGFAFFGCSSLTEIKIPDSVTTIGEFAFCNCSSLTEIEIPDGVTSIGESTFSNCSSLTKIKIPDSVTSIGEDAFFGCSSLTEIEIPDSVTSIGGFAFFGCSSLTEIEIPDSVTSIENGAFGGCDRLTEIEIPDSVTSIGDSAFDPRTNIKMP